MANKKFSGIKFWHIMVGTGIVLILVGLTLIIAPIDVGESGTIVISILGARFEGDDVGIALIVLGIICFLIGRKDRADMKKYETMRSELDKTSEITAKLVTNNVERRLASIPNDNYPKKSNRTKKIEEFKDELKEIQKGVRKGLKGLAAIREAEKGMKLLEELEKEDS